MEKLILSIKNFSHLLLFLIGPIFFSLILITTVFIYSQGNKQKKEITRLKAEIIKLQKEKESLIEEQPNVKNQINNIPTDGQRPSYVCTLTVKTLEEIQPVYGCLFTDITLRDFPINGKNNTIHAIFTQLTNEYDYSLDIYINDKEVKNNPLAKKAFNIGETPSLKYYRFIAIDKNNATQGLLVFGDREQQAPNEDIIVINSLGEVVFTYTEDILESPYDSDGEILTNEPLFRIEKVRLDPPEPFLCYSEDRHTPETIVTEFNTYMFVDNKVKHVKKEEITFEEACSGGENYNPID